jgi:hypothetical protein
MLLLLLWKIVLHVVLLIGMVLGFGVVGLLVGGMLGMFSCMLGGFVVFCVLVMALFFCRVVMVLGVML